MADEAENDDQWLYGDPSEITHEERKSDPLPAEEPAPEPEETKPESPLKVQPEK